MRAGCRAGLTVWVVTALGLCLWFHLGCGLATRGPKSSETTIVLQNVINRVNKTSFNCLLYMPMLSDYQKCPNTTWHCFKLEASVFILEWKNLSTLPTFTKGRSTSKLVNMLKKLNPAYLGREEGCPQCESYSRKGALEFLQGLLMVVQYMNSGQQGAVTMATHHGNLGKNARQRP